MKKAALRLSATLEGLSVESVALILTLGVVLGTFPVFGCPTVLCVLAALLLRINLPALQVVNQLASPLQIGLLAPLARLGAHLVSAPVGSGIAGKVGAAMVQAIAGWCCLCVPLGIASYFLLLYFLRRCPRPWSNVVESPA